MAKVKLFKYNINLGTGGSNGTGGMDNELRAELEAEISELKRQNMKLEQRLMNNTLNASVDNYEKKIGNVVRDYLAQIHQLKEENDRLKSKKTFILKYLILKFV